MAYLLIVDDDPDFASSVAAVCQAEGHEILTVHAPDRALAALAERRPDGILLDVMFPEDPGAGFQLARDIRRQFGQIPILMITAVNQKFPLGFGTRDIDPDWLPVNDFVEKPLDFSVLKEKVSQLLGSGSSAS